MLKCNNKCYLMVVINKKSYRSDAMDKSSRERFRTACVAQGLTPHKVSKILGVRDTQLYRVLEGESQNERIRRSIEVIIQDGKLRIAEMFGFCNSPCGEFQDRMSENKELAG